MNGFPQWVISKSVRKVRVGEESPVRQLNSGFHRDKEVRKHRIRSISPTRLCLPWFKSSSYPFVSRIVVLGPEAIVEVLPPRWDNKLDTGSFPPEHSLKAVSNQVLLFPSDVRILHIRRWVLETSYSVPWINQWMKITRLYIIQCSVRLFSYWLLMTSTPSTTTT
jgi:hypothetical protein